MNSDLLNYSQAGILLEKYENLLELSISLGQTMRAMWKTIMLILFVAKLGIFRIQQELSNSKSDQIPFKR